MNSKAPIRGGRSTMEPASGRGSVGPTRRAGVPGSWRGRQAEGVCWLVKAQSITAPPMISDTGSSKGFIDAAALTRQANALGKTAYGAYLRDLAAGKHA